MANVYFNKKRDPLESIAAEMRCANSLKVAELYLEMGKAEDAIKIINVSTRKVTEFYNGDDS